MAYRFARTASRVVWALWAHSRRRLHNPRLGLLSNFCIQQLIVYKIYFYFCGVHPVALNYYNFYKRSVNRNWNVFLFITISFTTTCFGPFRWNIHQSFFYGAINTTTDPLFSWFCRCLCMLCEPCYFRLILILIQVLTFNIITKTVNKHRIVLTACIDNDKITKTTDPL
jgi:hypothetical protein